VWVETFTGLRTRQLARLLKAVRERGGEGLRTGRPWCLPLAERVLPVAVYYRTNPTTRQLAPLFGVSPATVCRVICRLRPLLALEPVTRLADAADRLWIVDGALVPVRDRRVGVSGRTYRFSVNVQVIGNADTLPQTPSGGTPTVVAADRPAPGTTADARAWRASGPAEHCQGVAVLGDGAHLSTGLIVPHRKRPGRALPAGEEADNAEHRRVRARVEHTFARMKNYKILHDCRQRGDGLRGISGAGPPDRAGHRGQGVGGPGPSGGPSGP
jgi:hypothetical protein